MKSKSTGTKTGWSPNPVDEGILTEMGVKFTVVMVGEDEIDWEKSKENIGRIGRGVVQSDVEDYTCSMIDGDVFPMPILASVKDANGLCVAAGMHRCLAAKEAEVFPIQAYKVKADHEFQIRAISIATNRVVGNREGRSAALLNALYLVDVDGADVRWAAKHCKVNLETLQTKIRARKTMERAVAAGFKGTLPETAWVNLHSIHSDNVLLAAANHILLSKMGSGDVGKFTADVNKIKTESQQIAKIEKDSEAVVKYVMINQNDPVVKQKNTTPLPIRAAFFRGFHALEKVVDGKTSLTELQITAESDEHKTLKKEWRNLRANLNKIIG